MRGLCLTVSVVAAGGDSIDATQELLTLGLCNLVGSFASSIPITGSFSRSAVNHASGVRTPLGGVYTGTCVQEEILALQGLTLSLSLRCKPVWRVPDCQVRDRLPCFYLIFKVNEIVGNAAHFTRLASSITLRGRSCKLGRSLTVPPVSFAGVLIILALSTLTPYFFYIPKASLAAVIICAVIFMIEYEVVKPMWKSNRKDLIPTFATFILCLLIGVEYGILVGVAINIVFLLYPSARPNVRVEKTTVGVAPRSPALSPHR